ncbi:MULTISPECIES: TAXI family TRAP transporter solute-binding subunit [Haloferax]|uniref:C4-dicarboxylate ABC transporter substrate-binding protein n=2 Tax=Haloferax gibbonsii TaxID=35746 RepID=A0A0K1IWM4_HALGI|nr:MULTISPECIES: TAXI family TRAP transporter solute-binding subunit [Haloferax]AKU08952.1 C4-dicarboxylate ABC transporter substrate-binding protein [Haloferax gibbonsii]ELZ82006.1 immunogenic protein [Haloferax gibbonsii ATCC 33959]QOS13210.1 TRAP-type transport system periplasmic substrate-binding protein [Haloferax gibbonsii]RDZ53989.1 C4-dicarboxylate ABC transporter substrate-binding protein [Haloferax sp. Atlit-4N]REA06353.1 C4-dicarboxylate ABC transporter substrate-binding protein [Ha
MTRKLDRRQFIAATGAVGLAGLAGCSGGGGEETTTTTESGGEDTTTAEETTTESGGNGGTESRLSWHAGGTGGTYYPLSNEFKSVIEGQTDFTIQVQSTGASVENVGSLARGDADFALIQNDVAYFARNGEGIEAFQGSPVENLRGVATLYPETIHVVTLADTGIETPSDLSGATINTGDLGSGTQVNATQILEALGISDYSEQNTGFSQASDQLKNGDIDAAFVVGGWPVGAIEELAATEDVRIVPIEGENRTAVKDAAPFYADDEVPSGTYGLENPAPTVSVQAMIATNAEQPESTVESVTSAIFENVDELTIKTDFISKESAQDGMSIELHPGAQAYFG